MADQGSIAPKWAWATTTLLFLVAAIAFLNVSAMTDAVFVRAGIPTYAGLVFDAALVFLAAFLASGFFMRRHSGETQVRLKLSLAYAGAFCLWNLASFLLLANLYRFAPVIWGFAPYSLAQAIVACLIVFAAVELRGRLLERNLARRIAPGAVS